MKKKLIILFAIIFLFTFIIEIDASFNVTPNRFIFNIDQPTTEVLEITNNSNSPQRIRVYPGMADGQAEEHYLGEWLVIHPPVFTIEPGDTRGVRFSVRPPDDLADGEYRSLLYIEELALEDDIAEEQEGVDFQLLTKLGINLYGKYGDIDYDGELTEVEVDNTETGLEASGNFINQSNAHLRMEAVMRVIDNQGEIVKEDNMRFVVHRDDEKGYEQLIETDDDLSGYQLEVSFQLSDEVVAEYSTTID